MSMRVIIKRDHILILFSLFFSQISWGQIVGAKIHPVLANVYNSKYNLTVPSNNDNTIIDEMVQLPITITPIAAKYWGIDLSKIDPLISASIKYQGNISNIINQGVSISNINGEFASAHFPLSKLEDLNNMTEIIEIGISPVGSYTLDKSDLKVHGKEARTVTGQSGENIVVGIIDTGIDWSNIDFKNGTNTRIKFLWDQTDLDITHGSPPGGDFNYGIEYNNTTIDAGSCSEIDTDGHGTHVAGICVGNGSKAPSDTYIGMAPKADIIIVKTDFSKGSLLDGVTWIAQKAHGLNKPWVCNLSLGLKYTSFDGLGKLDQGISTIVNSSDIIYGTGKVIVASAGNDVYDANNPNSTDINRIHATGNSTATKRFTIVPDNSKNGEILNILIWCPKTGAYDISIIPQGNFGHVYSREFPTGDADGSGRAYLGANCDGLVCIYNGTDACHKENFTFSTDNMIVEFISIKLE
jgi:subtilisin family serine protease